MRGALRNISLQNLQMCPECQRNAAAWFHSKWGVPEDAYWKSMEDSLAGPGPVPQWNSAWTDESGQIVGGAGVIEKDRKSVV